jgi:hypothetical protein
MNKYLEEETNKLLQEIESITDLNEKSVIVSHIWWHNFSRDTHPRCVELMRLKRELPYPKKGVSIERIEELVRNFPPRFVQNLGAYIKPQFEGTPSKYGEHKKNRSYKVEIVHSVSSEIWSRAIS